MNRLTFFLILALIVVFSAETEARRTFLTPEQKQQLSKSQVVLVNVLALTEAGSADATALLEVVQRRLSEMGYTVHSDRSKPYDVEAKVKCEERKTWTGTTPAGGDAELADAPSRLWQGPACLFSYALDGKDLGWYKEVRTAFPDAAAAAQAAQADNAGMFALNALKQRLEEFDFPVLLSAEWGHIDRLLKVLDSPKTHKIRKVKILSLLSELHSEEALPQLTKLLQEKDLGKEAVEALSGTGVESLPLLIDLFKNSPQTEIRVAAAKALGDVAGSSGDPRTIPPLLDYLKEQLSRMKGSNDINFPLLTQVVWSLGRLRDENSVAPMAQLNKKVWLIYDTSPEMAELREATNWTWKQLDLDGHLS